jgi:hypothetical protein
MDIKPIKTQRDYRRALKQIEGLMTAKRGSPEGDRLDVLVALVRRGNAGTTRSTCRTRWRQSDTTWTRTDCNHATLFPSSVAAIASMRCSTVGAR